MRPKEHATLSTAAAIIALPWLKKDIWIPFASSMLIDVDHYLWHVATYRTLSLRAAIRYFGQADPPQLMEARLLHHPLVLGTLLFFRNPSAFTHARSHSRWLALSCQPGCHSRHQDEQPETFVERASGQHLS